MPDIMFIVSEGSHKDAVVPELRCLHLLRHVLNDKLHGAVHAVVDPPPVVAVVVIRLRIERHELGR